MEAERDEFQLSDPVMLMILRMEARKGTDQGEKGNPRALSGRSFQEAGFDLVWDHSFATKDGVNKWMLPLTARHQRDAHASAVSCLNLLDVYSR